MIYDDIIIFTDASVLGKANTKQGNKVIAGAYEIDNIKGKYYHNLYAFDHATNNFGELYGIYAAIKSCIYYREMYGCRSFTIYSDSMYSVNSIRDWYQGWYNKLDYNTNIIYTSSGSELKNRTLLDKIIATVVHELKGCKIKILHINGHLTMSKKDLEKSRKTFISSNFQNLSNEQYDKIYKLFTDKYKFFVDGNTTIDNVTRNCLNKKNYTFEDARKNPKYCMYITPDDIIEYSNIIVNKYNMAQYILG